MAQDAGELVTTMTQDAAEMVTPTTQGALGLTTTTTLVVQLTNLAETPTLVDRASSRSELHHCHALWPMCDPSLRVAACSACACFSCQLSAALLPSLTVSGV